MVIYNPFEPRMFSPFIFWMWFAGLIYFAAGVFVTRREVSTARGLEKLIALGRVFVATSDAKSKILPVLL